MTLFILFQTDNWQSRASRVCFGIFDSRDKAIDAAKYNGLYSNQTGVVVVEIILNQFHENY